MLYNPARHRALSVGVFVRRRPGVTRWQKDYWTVFAVLAGAADAEWRELRRDGVAVDYHLGNTLLELHGTETEAYLHELSSDVPSVYVVLAKSQQAEAGRPFRILMATVSPYEAQDYMDSGDEIVERVAMPGPIRAWVRDFVDKFHEEEVFVKRKRDKKRFDLVEDGIGDARIPQMADVYRSPASARKDRLT